MSAKEDTATDGKDSSTTIQRQQTQLQQQQQYPSWHSTVSGGAAGFCSRMATAPLDLIRIRRQLSVGVVYPSESLWQTWRNIVQQEGGVTALYRGNLAAIYLWVGYAATQFTVYSTAREALVPYNWNATAVAFCSGAVAGVCATATTYPFDVCRTTFVVQGTQQQQQQQQPATATATEEAVSATAESKTSATATTTASTRSLPKGYVERPITIQCEPVALSSTAAHHPNGTLHSHSHSHPHFHSHVHPAAPPSIDSFPEPRFTARHHPHTGGSSALPFSSLYEPCPHRHPFVVAVPPPPIPPHAPAAVTTPSSPTNTTTATTTTTPPRTFRAFAVTMYRQKGVAGFYAGSFPATIQIVPYMGLNFAIYDWLSTGNFSVLGSAYAGSVSGAVSKIAVYPLDTVKRRLQAQAFVDANSAAASDGSQQFYRGMWDCFVTIFRQEGWMSFYRGMVPSVLKTTISTSLSFAFYRWTRNGLEAAHHHLHS